MNLINAAATFVGEAQTETGVRCMEMKIPVQGAKAVEVPVFLIPTRSSGETFVPEAYEKGCTILFTGRLYPCKSDNRMYVAPTQPLQTVPNNTVLNQVSLAGGVGFIAEERREDLFNCGLLCQAPPQKLIGHTWDDSLPFRLEAWGDDAARMRKFLYKGRQIALTASLRFETWNSKDGPRAAYKIRVRSGMYSFFGKNKANANPIPVQQQDPAKSDTEPALATVIPKPVEKGDEIPF